MSPEERSPEERERARLEREAKRAAREGRPPPTAPPPTEVPPPPVEAPPTPPPPQPKPAPPPEPAPRAESPPTEAPPPARPQARRPEPPAPFEPGRAEPATAGGRPPPGRSAARRAIAQRILERRRDRGTSRSRIGRRRRLIPLAAAAIAGVVMVWFLVSLFQPFAGEGEGSVVVTIPAGSGVAEISDLLEEKGVVASSLFFRARATVTGRSGDFKAGRFVLRKDMSYGAAIDALAQSPDAQTVSVTIPEGRARREVKSIVEPVLDGDYLVLTKRSRLLDPNDYGARGASDLEGFLFPATYELKRGAGSRDLVEQQLTAFKREFATVDMSFAKTKNLFRYDVLVIASMVEREAQLPSERPVIASVIYNRLKEGIPLGIDATIRFATANWTEPLKASELALDSPYNTRLRQGLPPGPIGSPGLASIKAAARPTRTGFLYFVVKPNTCGEHDFSETLDEHNAKVARYDEERDARGGKSPTDC